MIKATLLFIFVTLVVSNPLDATAGTYNCTAVDKKASVGVSDRSSVSITTGDKTCQFSVNGASVNAKKTAAFLTQMNRLLDSRSSTYSANDLDALQTLIMGPFSAGSDIDFRNSVRNRANEIGRCISTRGRNSVEDSFNDVLCKAFSPQELMRGGFPGISVESKVSILVLSATVSRQQYFLFVPIPLLDAGDKGFQFR